MLPGQDRARIRGLDPGRGDHRRLKPQRAELNQRVPKGTEREDAMKERRWSYRGCACCDGNTLALSGAALSRRNFIAGAAAVASFGVGKPHSAAAQAAEAAKPYRIDVHHHLSPPSYVAASNVNHFGEPPMKSWTPEKS